MTRLYNDPSHFADEAASALSVSSSPVDWPENRQYDFDEASASAGRVERISAYEGSDMGSTV